MLSCLSIIAGVLSGRNRRSEQHTTSKSRVLAVQSTGSGVMSGVVLQASSKLKYIHHCRSKRIRDKGWLEPTTPLVLIL